MKISADTAYQGLRGATLTNDETVSLKLTTEPSEDGEFIEVQVAELRDGSLNIVIAGEVANTISRDIKGFANIRVWPTVKGEKA